MAVEPVVIVGVDPRGIDVMGQDVQELIANSDELWGSSRLLALWPDYPGQKVALGHGLLAQVAQLSGRPDGRRIVILASGDPGFFGIAASVLKVLPAEEVHIHPAISSLQAAFARVGLTWSDAIFTSVHARPMAEVIGWARRFPKLGILTDPQHHPGWIAKRLLAAGVADCRVIVLENIGIPQEKVMDTRLCQLPSMTFAPLNVLVLNQDEDWRPAPVIQAREDDVYQHVRGMITKRDIRLMSLSRLALRTNDVVWDIGAGSGAMSVEMAELAWRGKVYAIERDAACLACIRENVEHFGLMNLEIAAGEAPQVLADLPLPHAIFIGGTGGRLPDILEWVYYHARPGTHLTANFTLLENMLKAKDWMAAHGWNPQLTQAQLSYGSPVGQGTRLAPINPVFILSTILPQEESV